MANLTSAEFTDAVTALAVYHGIERLRDRLARLNAFTSRRGLNTAAAIAERLRPGSPPRRRENVRHGDLPGGTGAAPRGGGLDRHRWRVGRDGGGDHRRAGRSPDRPRRRLPVPRRDVDGRVRRHVLRLLLPG